jgi:predicted lactoylglutathione lyase
MAQVPKMIFVNLPVADVAKATAFYEAIGFEKNPAFSNDQASSMVWSDTIYVMLLGRPFYATFTPKPIADAKTTSGALFALSFDSKADVDKITEAAIGAGGGEPHGPEDHGFMYSRAFEDLDGHGWGPFWMDPAAAAGGPPEHQPTVDASPDGARQ